MKITQFQIKKVGDKILNVVVPTKNIESNLFKEFRKNFEGSVSDVNMNITITAVESSGSEFCYARSVNKGVESLDADYYLNVNDDIRLFDGSLKQALINMASNKDLGLHGAVLYHPNGKIVNAGTGVVRMKSLRYFVYRTLHNKAPFFAIRQIARYSDKHNPVAFMQYNQINKNRRGVLIGAFNLFDAETYGKVGGYDESYRMGYEDMDFCLGVLKSGRKIRLDAHTKAIHYEGTSGVDYCKKWNDADYFYNKWWDGDIVMKMVEQNGCLFLP